MKLFSLTPAELMVAKVLVSACLENMGGDRPADLELDEMTFVEVDDLHAAGYSKHQAAGFFSSLSEKGFLETNKNETFVTTDGWKWLDTVWDAA